MVPIEYTVNPADDPIEYHDGIEVGEKDTTGLALSGSTDFEKMLGGKVHFPPPLPPGPEPEITCRSRRCDLFGFLSLLGRPDWFDSSRKRGQWFGRGDREDEILFQTSLGRWALLYIDWSEPSLPEEYQRVPGLAPWGEDVPDSRELEARDAAIWLVSNGHSLPDDLLRFAGQLAPCGPSRLDWNWLPSHKANSADSPTAVEAVVGEQPPGSLGTKSPQAAQNGKRKREPSREAFLAYTRYVDSGWGQAIVARKMSQEFGRPIGQGQVSRWVRSVKEWREAENLWPGGMYSPAKVIPVDPCKLDEGPREQNYARRK